MKKSLLFLFVTIALLKVNAQDAQWVYDFGTVVAAPYTSATYSTTYLPAAQSGGGTAGIRAGSTTEGPVELLTEAAVLN